MERGAPALLLLLSLAGCLGAPSPPPRNVVLITFDTTRADALGAYGGDSATSPVFDALAAHGTLFLHAQAQAAVTPVAHASILTGLNPYHHGLRTLHGNRLYSLPEDVPTLAARLRDLGYETAAFVSAFPCTGRFGLDQGFDLFDADFGAAPSARIGAAGNVSTGLAQRGAAATTEAALKWLAGRAGDRPYFLWVHYFDPHDPLLRPPVSRQEAFMDGFPRFAEMEEALSGDPELFVADYVKDPDLMRGWLRRLYRVEVSWADAQMGRLFAAMGAGGGLERTVVAVTADHGEGLGDHEWWGHGILYQEQLHVPLVLAGPGVPPELKVVDRVRHVDLAPTLLQLAAGTAFERQVDGISLLPLMARRAAGGEPGAGERPGPAYADAVTLMRYGAVFDPQVREVRDDQLYAWIDSDLKWIRHRLHQEKSELYDLAADPGELVNLVPAQPRDAGRLDRALEQEHPMTEEIEFSLPEDDEVRRRLRSLGYVD
jgi:arylsulfatase A-like enzyme